MDHKKLPMYERTLVIIKPEAVQRGIMGEIISRFERKGLKIIGMRMVWPSKDLVEEHYSWPDSDRLLLGERTLKSFHEKGIEDNRDPMAIAAWVHTMLVDHLVTGPVVAMVLAGAHAVDHVRKLRGSTNPLDADVGTITGDFSVDSYQLADAASRSIRSIVHASGSVAEAKREVALWFKETELFNYDLAIEKILYAKEWESIRPEE